MKKKYRPIAKLLKELQREIDKIDKGLELCLTINKNYSISEGWFWDIDFFGNGDMLGGIQGEMKR